MGQRPKCKSKNHKIPEKETGQKIYYTEFGHGFLYVAQETQT